jgi:HPt (histidine-containing phosphotransfer) domain-containing protein
MSDGAHPAVRQLWLQKRSITLERLTTVQRALDQLAAGRTDQGVLDEARMEAHRLRGILGTFGFPEGTDLAAEAEDVFDADADPAVAGDLAARLAAYRPTLEA